MPSKNTVRMFLNVASGGKREPPISNELFLESFGQYTVWVRALHANRMLEGWSKDSNGRLNNLIATISVYEQLGMFVEDVICTLAAWGAWKRNPALLLGDLLERIVFISDDKKWDPKAAQYHDAVFDRLAQGSGKERFDPHLLVSSLKTLTHQNLLLELGVPWKKFPSVKFVEKHWEQEWQKLPLVASGLLSSIDDPKMPFLSKGYNKLKHGPQMVVMDADECIRRRGHPALRDGSTSWAYARLLFSGSRTQELDNELDNNKRVAPFLISDLEVLRKNVFGTMFFTAISMATIGNWLFRRHFGRHFVLPKDPSWEKMRDEWCRMNGI